MKKTINGKEYDLVPFANLSSANLYGANLYGANLYGADLHGADLRYANLRDANLRGADLRDANLRYANLRGADLRGADLRDANLRYANLYGADLHSANLRGADLRGADLRDANLRGADLHGADLRSAKNIPDSVLAQTSIVPDTGSFIGWKLCQNNVLVKLQIPASAKRSNATGRKCRANKAKVLDVIGAKTGVSQHDVRYTYKKGQVIVPDSFDDDRWNECSHGIHFFITRWEAENYV